jgi:hypothetical protein
MLDELSVQYSDTETFTNELAKLSLRVGLGRKVGIDRFVLSSPTAQSLLILLQ